MPDFSNVQVGDKVRVFFGGLIDRRSEVVEVVRVTRTQFTTRGHRFTKAHGMGIGDRYTTGLPSVAHQVKEVPDAKD
jgi:hypothetical protein